MVSPAPTPRCHTTWAGQMIYDELTVARMRRAAEAHAAWLQATYPGGGVSYAIRSLRTTVERSERGVTPTGREWLVLIERGPGDWTQHGQVHGDEITAMRSRPSERAAVVSTWPVVSGWH